MRNQKKIFVIGFHKTGTTSLARALQVLGYRVCGFITPEIAWHPANKKELFESEYKPLLDEYDAFEDTLWFLFYKELSEMYPDARFILNIREEESWYKSMVKHFGGYDRKIFHWVYDGHGDPVGNKELYIERFRQHNHEVRGYFKGRNHAFLEMRLPEDFNWEVLCGFLNCKEPLGSFPHANSASLRAAWRRKIINRVKARYYKYNQA